MDKPQDLLGKVHKMEHMTIGEALASLEADHSRSATFPFPALGLTLKAQAVAPYQFLVEVTPDGEEPALGVLPINKLGPLLANMTEADTRKAAEGLTDEAEAFLKAEAQS
jgi:hypothetical protein